MLLIRVVFYLNYEHGNFAPTVLPQRPDAFCHRNETRPLHLRPAPEKLPEAYPRGV